MSVYDIVTERIMEKLKQGQIPWRKPWGDRPTVNWVSRRSYSGINLILLEPGEYATWNQIKKAGGKVKKGAKSNIVVFWKLHEIEDRDTTGKPKTVPCLRYYRVFNINDCEGLESKYEEIKDHDPIEEAEKIIEGYQDRPPIAFGHNKAYYCPTNDTISVPDKGDYDNIEFFYTTLFHELIHSTGHKDRLNRPGINREGVAAFELEQYSKEELIAEIGAAMLAGVAKIEMATIENHTAYVQSWLKALNDDRTMVVSAASQAQKAVDYILGRADSDEQEH